TPELSLSYLSLRGNGSVGVGWGFDLGSIERNTKNGLDYAGTSFVFTKGGTSQELVQVPNTNEYRLRVDDGSFLRFFFASTPTKPSSVKDGWTRVRSYFSKLGRPNPRTEAGTGWTVYDKSGIVSYYGSTPASRLANPNNADQHAKWYLDRTQDPNGNYFTV